MKKMECLLRKTDQILWDFMANRWQIGDIMQVSKITYDMGKVNREQPLIFYVK